MNTIVFYIHVYGFHVVRLNHPREHRRAVIGPLTTTFPESHFSGYIPSSHNKMKYLKVKIKIFKSVGSAHGNPIFTMDQIEERIPTNRQRTSKGSRLRRSDCVATERTNTHARTHTHNANHKWEYKSLQKRYALRSITIKRNYSLLIYTIAKLDFPCYHNSLCYFYQTWDLSIAYDFNIISDTNPIIKD